MKSIYSKYLIFTAAMAFAGILAFMPCQQANATIGGTIILPQNSNVSVKFLFTDTAWDDVVGLSSPRSQSLIAAHGTAVGSEFSLGSFNAGTELVFYLNNAHGNTWLSGAASKNSDHVAHMDISSLSANQWQVNFEDMPNGGDRDYNDVQILVTATPSCTSHSTKKCVGNSVYWYNSCDSQEELYQACTSSQTCSNGACIDNPITPVCSSNSDCGPNGYVGGLFCKNNSSVYQVYRTYTCNNAGTASSTCTHSDTDQLKTTCSASQTCSNGSCVNNEYTCDSDSDCQSSDYSSPFCYGGNVYRDYTTYKCKNPGTASSYCSPSITKQLYQTCTSSQTCSGGSCNTNTTNLSVSCYATPSSANVNETVTFACSVSGGTGSYTYSWSGACTGSSANCTNSYSTSGTRSATVTVTSGGQSVNASASVSINQNCSYHSYQRCSGNYLYWYDSCGNQQDSQYCSNGCYNGYCQNNTCTQRSYQQCVGNAIYWYDSCGNQKDFIQYCSNGCSGGSCSNYNGYLTVSKTVKNLTQGTSYWASGVSANPSDVLMFMITLQPTNQSVYNVTVRDYLPNTMIYRNNLVVSGGSYYSNYNYSGDITSGVNVGTISSGQTVTITYQAQVAPASTFSYGTTTVKGNTSVTSSQSGNSQVNEPSVLVNRTAVYGATDISTGLTNNILMDSFLLPLIISLAGIWMLRMGMFGGLEKWIAGRKNNHKNYKAEKELQARISKIQKNEA